MMSRRHFREQRAAALVAVTGGVFFWLGYSLVKGILFAIVVMLILQVPLLVEHWKDRNQR